MSVLNENTIIGASGAGGEYEIKQSLRFDSDAYLEWTPAAAGNRKTWTYSCWVKLGNIGVTSILFDAYRGDGSAVRGAINVNTENEFEVVCVDNSSVVYRLKTSALLRDSSAWYHLLVAFDTTQSTSSNRVKMYINGTRVTSFGTEVYPNQNTEYQFNNTDPHRIGRNHGTTYSDAYLAEVNFIDGQALTPDSFGETGDYGEWKPTKYAGAYGTNGFYLPFEQDYSVEGFSTVTYEGNSSSNHYIGGTGFSPDVVWIKGRISGYNHQFYDSVRGATKVLETDSTNVDETRTDGLLSFDTDGFSLGSQIRSNYAGQTYVAWNWDMGGTTASNTNGSITSSVRANTTYGQSIVSYTGNGNSNVSIGHGLGQIPDIVIIKPRGRDDNWVVSGQYIGAEHDYMYLNATGAAGGAANTRIPNADANNINLGTFWNNINTSGIAHIAYCFSSVTGYSKIGSYSGTGSSGNAITTGFAPAFVMIKRTDSALSWFIHDNVRDPSNPNTAILKPNSDSEEFNGTAVSVDFLSTGFQLKNTDASFNASGGTYLYMAFADTREYAYWLDQSGNNNDWTSEGGLTESDVMVDSPTNNFCTFNPIDQRQAAPITYSEGNLKFTLVSGSQGRGTIPSTVDSKFYLEFCTPSDVSNTNVMHVGLASTSININASGSFAGGTGGACVGTYFGGNDYFVFAVENGVEPAGSINVPGTKIAAGGIVGFAYDAATGKVWMSINNSWLKANGQFDGSNPLSSSNYLYQVSAGSQLTPITMPVGNFVGVLNCGQDSSFAGNKTPQGNQDSNGIGDFYYAPPAGFLSLSTKSLDTPTVIPSENFNTVLYTGNQAANVAVTGVGFQPDLVWGKNRSSASNHWLFDSVRGINKMLQADQTNAEETQSGVRAFNSFGFTLGTWIGSTKTNDSYVAWNWKAGGSASSNTNGSITSSVSANPSAGFSVVSHTSTGATGTVGHGLGVAPKLIIEKTRNLVEGWLVQTSVIDGTHDYLWLNTTAAKSNMPWGSLPTSTVFSSYGHTVGTTKIAYCFADVDGYSKVGSYTGNGSTDGPFVHCGFKVAMIIQKRTDGADSWHILDNKRSPSNVVDDRLYPNSSSAESTSGDRVDFTSNGFKVRTTNGDFNASGGTYIFIAFAESPFKHTNAR